MIHMGVPGAGRLGSRSRAPGLPPCPFLEGIARGNAKARLAAIYPSDRLEYDAPSYQKRWFARPLYYVLVIYHTRGFDLNTFTSPGLASGRDTEWRHPISYTQSSRKSGSQGKSPDSDYDRHETGTEPCSGAPPS